MSTSAVPTTPPDTNECALCYDPFSATHPAAALPNCRHVFGRECIEKWMTSDNAQRNRCPECRALIDEGAPEPVPDFDEEEYHPRPTPARTSPQSFSQQDHSWGEDYDPYPDHGYLTDDAMSFDSADPRPQRDPVAEAAQAPREQRRGVFSRIRDVFRRPESRRGEVREPRRRLRRNALTTATTTTSVTTTTAGGTTTTTTTSVSGSATRDRRFEASLLNFERRGGRGGGTEYRFSLALGGYEGFH